MSSNLSAVEIPALAPRDVVNALADARRLGSTVETRWSPASPEEAYAAQGEVRRALGEGIGGWKAAGLDPSGIPLLAPIHISDVSGSGSLACPAEGWILEVEYGFRLGRDLPRSAAYHKAEVMDAVDEVHVCFELCRSRLAAPSPPRLLFLADGLANDRLVVGSGVSPRDLSLGHRGVRLSIDGEVVKELQSSAGDEATEALVWLARQPLPEGGLKAGHIIITGSLTGTTRIRGGQIAEALIEGIGQVRVDALP